MLPFGFSVLASGCSGTTKLGLEGVVPCTPLKGGVRGTTHIPLTCTAVPWVVLSLWYRVIADGFPAVVPFFSLFPEPAPAILEELDYPVTTHARFFGRLRFGLCQASQ